MTALSAWPTWNPSALGFSRFCSRYHSSVGRKPPSSPLRPRPVGAPSPRSDAELGQAVHHAGPRAELVEVDVAALDDGVVEAHHAVGLGALEPPARDLERPVALGLVLGRDEAVLQRRDRRDRLERRPRVVGLGQRLVVQRVVAVGEQPLLGLDRQVPRHLVGIEARLGGHRQDAPAVDVQHHHARRRGVAQRPLGEPLRVGVQRQHHVVAGHRRLRRPARRSRRGCRSWASRAGRRRSSGSPPARAGSRPTAARSRCGR